MSIERKFPLKALSVPTRPKQALGKRQLYGTSSARPKTAVQAKPSTAAPPVYRPQAVPKVLQTKKPAAHQPVNQTNRTPVAPPVYRPQPTPKVLQSKMKSGQGLAVGESPRRPVAPPVYRPEHKKVLQPMSTPTTGMRKPPATPAANRHLQTPALLQPKKAQNQTPPNAGRKSVAPAVNLPGKVRGVLQPHMGGAKGVIQRGGDYGTFTQPTPPRTVDTTLTDEEMRRWALRDMRDALRDMAEYQSQQLYPDTSPLLNRANKLADLAFNYGTLFGLDEYEELALKAYGDANKGVKEFGYEDTHVKTRNPHYMFDDPMWGVYQNGWNALTSALKKLPSLGNLGLDIPTFRIEREDSKLVQFLQGTSGPLYICHGMTKDKKGGQPHFMSASIIPSSHSNVQNSYKRGLVKVMCKSARYINAFSVQGIVDGGEVLIPPGVVTLYKGTPEKQVWMGETVDVYVLTQVTGYLNPHIPIIDDFTLEDRKQWAKDRGLYNT